MWANAGVCFQSSEILTHHTQPARKHENTLPLGSRLQEGLLVRPPAWSQWSCRGCLSPGGHQRRGHLSKVGGGPGANGLRTPYAALSFSQGDLRAARCPPPSYIQFLRVTCQRVKCPPTATHEGSRGAASAPLGLTPHQQDVGDTGVPLCPQLGTPRGSGTPLGYPGERANWHCPGKGKLLAQSALCALPQTHLWPSSAAPTWPEAQHRACRAAQGPRPSPAHPSHWWAGPAVYGGTPPPPTSPLG